jgi:hypothetical protein
LKSLLWPDRPDQPPDQLEGCGHVCADHPLVHHGPRLSLAELGELAEPYRHFVPPWGIASEIGPTRQKWVTGEHEVADPSLLHNMPAAERDRLQARTAVAVAARGLACLRAHPHDREAPAIRQLIVAMGVLAPGEENDL